MFKGAAPIVLWLLVSVNVAFGCECANGTPIQRTSERYRDRAVFTAHVIQLVGRIYDFKSEPKRMSSQALAVVKDRYWGLPWYWPKAKITWFPEGGSGMAVSYTHLDVYKRQHSER